MEIRNYQLGDEKNIIALFKEVFKKDISSEYWQWRFQNNPLNKIMIKLMWDVNTLAGHYAVSPVMLNVDGKEVLAALSMTTMVHPHYGGKGIFTTLANALYEEEAKEQNLGVVWGFPNDNSHYGFIKNLNWKNIDITPTFSLAVDKILPVEHTEIVKKERFSLANQEAYERMTGKYPVKVQKSVDYLNWRYCDNPVNKYTIVEYQQQDAVASYFAVAKPYLVNQQTGEYEIDLVELCFPADEKLLRKLFYAIVQHFKELTLIKLNCWMPLNDPSHIQLEKIGFKNSMPITYSGFIGLGNDDLASKHSDSWYYSMGDSDVY